MDQTAKDLNSNGTLIAASFKDTKTPKTVLPLLTDHKSLVMIFKPSMGDNLQITTFHTNYGSALLMHKKSLIAVSGLQSGNTVEIEMSDVSKFSTSAPVPDLDLLLNATSLSDLENIVPDPNYSERVSNVAVIIPKLATELLDLQDFSPK